MVAYVSGSSSDRDPDADAESSSTKIQRKEVFIKDFVIEAIIIHSTNGASSWQHPTQRHQGSSSILGEE